MLLFASPSDSDFHRPKIDGPGTYWDLMNCCGVSPSWVALFIVQAHQYYFLDALQASRNVT